MVTANQVSLMIVVVWCVVNFGIVRVVGMKLRGAGRVLGLPILLHIVGSGGLVGGGGNWRERRPRRWRRDRGVARRRWRRGRRVDHGRRPLFVREPRLVRRGRRVAVGSWRGRGLLRRIEGLDPFLPDPLAHLVEQFVAEREVVLGIIILQDEKNTDESSRTQWKLKRLT